MNSIFNHDKNTGLNSFRLELKISLTSAHQYVIFLRCDKFPLCYIPSLCLIPLQCFILSLLLLLGHERRGSQPRAQFPCVA